MSALYAMRYANEAGRGAGAVYIGKGIISGIDVADVRFDGSYTDNGSELSGKVTMLRPRGGASSGTPEISHPASVEFTFSLPAHFADGQPYPFSVDGLEVHVIFEKLKDVP